MPKNRECPINGDPSSLCMCHTDLLVGPFNASRQSVLLIYLFFLKPNRQCYGSLLSFISGGAVAVAAGGGSGEQKEEGKEEAKEEKKEESEEESDDDMGFGLFD